MRLFNQTTAECTNLFTVLHAIEAPEKRAFLFDRVLPFELEVLHAKTLYWAGDHMGYLDALALLLARCKTQAKNASRKHDPSGVAMWKERGARMCLIIASQLIEMKVDAPEYVRRVMRLNTGVAGLYRRRSTPGASVQTRR